MKDKELQRLAALAQTAELHAESRDLAGMDRALDASRADAGPHDVLNLASCYGAWLGEFLRRELGARWIGLGEPSPPRLVVSGRVISPMDVVRRRLDSASAPTVARVLDIVRGWTYAPPDRGRVLKRNLAAWNDPSLSGPFNARDMTLTRETALESLDPWVAREGVGGKRVLCMGAGGAMQSLLLAHAGAAEVVVVDLSEEQLKLDRKAALDCGMNIRTVQASIDDLSPLGDAAFDLVVQPVCTSYVPDVDRVHREVARVLRDGGLYVVQHKHPASLQQDRPYVEGRALEPETGAHREEGCIEFLHTIESLVGGLCRAGFVVEDLIEPPLADALAPEGSAERRAETRPPYLKIRARRRVTSP